MAGIEKDEQFYMTLVTIQVEECLFRVPRQSLESQSKVFRDMFSLPTATNAEGSCDVDPIRLDGIKKGEFKRFLEVLFRGHCQETTEQCPIFDTWFPVVKLAHMWEFDGIHKHAVEKLPYHQIYKPPAEMVGLAVQCDIRSWLLPGLNDLAKRKDPLGNSDLELLGPELILKVAAVRESLTIERGRNRLSAGTRDAREVDFTPVIKRVFQLSGSCVRTWVADSGTPVTRTA